MLLSGRRHVAEVPHDIEPYLHVLWGASPLGGLEQLWINRTAVLCYIKEPDAMVQASVKVIELLVQQVLYVFHGLLEIMAHTYSLDLAVPVDRLDYGGHGVGIGDQKRFGAD